MNDIAQRTHMLKVSRRTDRFAPRNRASRRYLVLIAISLLCALTLSRAQSAPLRRKSSKPSGLSAGRQTFEVSCAPCHGLNGKGGDRAPDIAAKPEIVRLSDSQLLKVLQAGKPQAGMPAFAMLGSNKLSEVLDYIRALQGRRKPQKTTGVDTTLGKELYASKAHCSDCHMIHGTGGFIGPDLSDYEANHSPDDIRDAILSADKRPSTHKALATITTRNGQRISGLVKNEDNFSVQLQSLEGTFHMLEKSSIAEFTFDSSPVMPGDYGAKLSKDDLDQLVAYLSNLTEAEQ